MLNMYQNRFTSRSFDNISAYSSNESSIDPYMSPQGSMSLQSSPFKINSTNPNFGFVSPIQVNRNNNITKLPNLRESYSLDDDVDTTRSYYSVDEDFRPSVPMLFGQQEFPSSTRQQMLPTTKQFILKQHNPTILQQTLLFQPNNSLIFTSPRIIPNDIIRYNPFDERAAAAILTLLKPLITKIENSNLISEILILLGEYTPQVVFDSIIALLSISGDNMFSDMELAKDFFISSLIVCMTIYILRDILKDRTTYSREDVINSYNNNAELQRLFYPLSDETVIVTAF